MYKDSEMNGNQTSQERRCQEKHVRVDTAMSETTITTIDLLVSEVAFMTSLIDTYFARTIQANSSINMRFSVGSSSMFIQSLLE